jgi:transcriptional regulator with GAF, ATPase, and Fis domain
MTNAGDRTSIDPSPPAPKTRERRLAEVFVLLADTLVADFDVVDVLDQLVQACVDPLGSTAAGLLLDDQRGHLTVMASSAESSRLVELFQVQNEQGPCLDCYRTGQPVTVPDLTAAIDRWPLFAPVAIEQGFHSVHALPLRLRNDTIGALNLFHSASTPLDDDDRRIAQALADTATIGILQQRALSAGNILSEQLQSALNSRIAIEQAKGVLAATGDVDMDRAFELLRRHARNNNLRISDLARQVANRTVDISALLG